MKYAAVRELAGDERIPELKVAAKHAKLEAHRVGRDSGLALGSELPFDPCASRLSIEVQNSIRDCGEVLNQGMLDY